jgi:hypothetical protein
MAKEVGREEIRWDLLQRGAGTHGDFPPTPARLGPAEMIQTLSQRRRRATAPAKGAARS